MGATYFSVFFGYGGGEVVVRGELFLGKDCVVFSRELLLCRVP